jgi:hypothetical protein
VRPLLSAAFFVILDTVIQPLELVLLLQVKMKKTALPGKAKRSCVRDKLGL